MPLDWMYPHLTPHGLILKINRDPLTELPRDVMDRDGTFWRQRQTEFIGTWLTSDTSWRAVGDFVEKIFLRNDLTEFDGDREFVRNAYATAAYSKLRSSQADVYRWRSEQAKSADDRRTMSLRADFAYKQSWALCPTSPEAVFQGVNLCLREGRAQDALVIAGTAKGIQPKNPQWGY